jgi:Zn finger protein HypA/HybF involved in hydrogenase expression
MKHYTIVKNATGDRFVKLASGTLVPADIAALGAGKDAWMRDIPCKCRDCKQPFPLSQLQGNGQWCEECATADIND